MNNIFSQLCVLMNSNSLPNFRVYSCAVFVLSDNLLYVVQQHHVRDPQVFGFDCAVL